MSTVADIPNTSVNKSKFPTTPRKSTILIFSFQSASGDDQLVVDSLEIGVFNV
jgi:hypothetical protein